MSKTISHAPLFRHSFITVLAFVTGSILLSGCGSSEKVTRTTTEQTTTTTPIPAPPIASTTTTTTTQRTPQ